MKNRYIIIGILVSFIFFPILAYAQCGKWRRDVKVLIDDSAQKILLMPPLTTTVEEFNKKIHKPQLHIDMNPDGVLPRLSEERQLVKIKNVVIVMYKIESNDNDIHVVLKSPSSNQTFVAEIPNPDCSDLVGHKALQNRYRKIRNWFIANIAQNNIKVDKFVNAPPNSSITIVGVPFWDADHNGSTHPIGAGPHFRELHPVVDFINSNGSVINQ